MTPTRRSAASFAIASLAASLTLASCSSAPQEMTVNGTVAVEDIVGQAPAVDTGSQVTVTDPSGKVIAFTTLNGNAKQGALFTLTFGFTVKVPEGESSYGITVSGLTGTTQFTQAQMQQGPAICAGNACNG
jgi:hypothetical protein